MIDSEDISSQESNTTTNETTEGSQSTENMTQERGYRPSHHIPEEETDNRKVNIATGYSSAKRSKIITNKFFIYD